MKTVQYHCGWNDHRSQITYHRGEDNEDALDEDSATSLWADQGSASHWPSRGGWRGVPVSPTLYYASYNGGATLYFILGVLLYTVLLGVPVCAALYSASYNGGATLSYASY